MGRSAPIRYAHGVVYPPKPEAARQQHRIASRDRDGRRRNAWRADRADAEAAAHELVGKPEHVQAAETRTVRYAVRSVICSTGISIPHRGAATGRGRTSESAAG